MSGLDGGSGGGGGGGGGGGELPGKDGLSGGGGGGGGGGSEGGAAGRLEGALGGDEELEAQLMSLEGEDATSIRALTREVRMEVDALRAESTRLARRIREQEAILKENKEKIKLNTQLPYLVGTVQEILEMDETAGESKEERDAATAGAEDKLVGAAAVVKTSTRQTMFLPVPGIVPTAELKPGDLVGTNKDSFIILEKLPAEYDSRVQAMELDETPTEDYGDIGGLDKQVLEMREAVELPLTQADRFAKIGIEPPKGILMYGPPGTGKTLLARAVAKNTDAVFLKLAGPQLVQMYIGDGAKMVRDAFELAREKMKDRGGAIIFIDEIDAIGTKRFNSDASGDREVQRTMLELLNQLDGFSSDTRIKVIAATNRPDILDPALMRSGRLDRKIELPAPTEDARAQILQIHSRKMRVDMESVNFEELARSTEDYNGAMLKAVCVEAGMIALRNEADMIRHEDFVEGISAVAMKAKASLTYYA